MRLIWTRPSSCRTKAKSVSKNRFIGRHRRKRRRVRRLLKMIRPSSNCHASCAQKLDFERCIASTQYGCAISYLRQNRWGIGQFSTANWSGREDWNLRPLVPNQKPIFYLVVPHRLALRRTVCYLLVFGSQWTQNRTQVSGILLLVRICRPDF
jgi:hypothetical protein